MTSSRKSCFCSYGLRSIRSAPSDRDLWEKSEAGPAKQRLTSYLYACLETIIELERMCTIKRNQVLLVPVFNFDPFFFISSHVRLSLTQNEWALGKGIYSLYVAHAWRCMYDFASTHDQLHYSQHVLRCLLSIICILLFIFSCADIWEDKIIRQQRQPEKIILF